MSTPDLTTDDELAIAMPDELTVLKERADLMGITYHPSIGVEKLREKINAKLKGEASEEVVAKPGVAVESENARRARKKREAAALVRIRLTCMNPFKTQWKGEIITAGNSVVGSFKKFVPFNAPEGYHVPKIIYDQLVERQCQVFVKHKDEKGRTINEGKLIKEFAIEVLPPLTQAQLDELARRQALANAID